MYNKKIQVKHVETLPILQFLDNIAPRMAISFDRDFENSIFHAVPEEIPRKVMLSKLRNMIEKGIIDGCACGCRGDFELTQKGKDILNNP